MIFNGVMMRQRSNSITIFVVLLLALVVVPCQGFFLGKLLKRQNKHSSSSSIPTKELFYIQDTTSSPTYTDGNDESAVLQLVKEEESAAKKPSIQIIDEPITPSVVADVRSPRPFHALQETLPHQMMLPLVIVHCLLL